MSIELSNSSFSARGWCLRARRVVGLCVSGIEAPNGVTGRHSEPGEAVRRIDGLCALGPSSYLAARILNTTARYYIETDLSAYERRFTDG